MLINSKTISLLVGINLVSIAVYANQTTAPADRGGPRFVSTNNDYSFLKDPENRTGDFNEKLNYINWDDNPDSYLTIGGEVRYYYQNKEHLYLGLAENDSNSVLLQRLRLYGDYHFNKKSRIFVEFGDNREYGPEYPTPVNYSPFDIQQMFVDYGFDYNDKSFNLRAGRFYMPLGSWMMFAPRDGANVWYAYDGLKFDIEKFKDYKVELFYTNPVNIKRGSLNNDSDEDVTIMGANVNKKLLKNDNIDVYAFRKAEEKAFDNHRDSLGLRYYGKQKNITYDVEAAYQTGEFNNKDISALGIFSRLNYSLDDKNSILVRANHFGGDDNLADNDVKTFEPVSVGPANLTRSGFFGLKNTNHLELAFIHKYDQKATVHLGASMLNKAQSEDHIYITGRGNNNAAQYTDDKHIANIYELMVQYKYNRNLNFQFNYYFIDAQDALTAINGKDTNAYSLITQFRF